MKLIEVKQGTVKWFEARAGKPTASCFSVIVGNDGQFKKPRSKADQKAGKLPDGMNTYLNELLAEPYWIENHREYIDMGLPTTGPMKHGQDTETEAVRIFQMLTDLPVAVVGFCLSDCGRYGASPDGLIQDADFQNIAGLEIKCPVEKTHAGYLRAGCIPEDYVAQVHGGMAVTGLRKWFFMSYCPPMPALIVKAEWCQFTEDVKTGVERFCDILDVERAKFQQLTEGAA